MLPNRTPGKLDVVQVSRTVLGRQSPPSSPVRCPTGCEMPLLSSSRRYPPLLEAEFVADPEFRDRVRNLELCLLAREHILAAQGTKDPCAEEGPGDQDSGVAGHFPLMERTGRCSHAVNSVFLSSDDVPLMLRCPPLDRTLLAVERLEQRFAKALVLSMLGPMKNFAACNELVQFEVLRRLIPGPVTDLVGRGGVSADCSRRSGISFSSA